MAKGPAPAEPETGHPRNLLVRIRPATRPQITGGLADLLSAPNR